MLDFTTETILNDLSKVKVVLGALSAPASAVSWDPGIEAGKKAFQVERVNKFIVGGTSDSIKGSKVYRRSATATVLASSQVTIPTVVVGTLYKVGLYIHTNNYADGQYARDRTTYGKPFFIELVATATSSTTAAAAIAAAWNKTYITYDNFVNATSSGANLVFTAVGNPFISFKNITLESIDLISGTPTDLAPTVTVLAAGLESFGDFTYLIKNHRLPTLDNNRPFGENQEELPVMGATYNQYTLEYVTDRGSMDASVVGGLSTSKTTHVFYVNNTAARVSRHLSGISTVTGSYNFEEMLKSAGLTVIDITAGDVTAGIAVITEA